MSCDGTDIARSMIGAINKNIPGRWPRLFLYLDLIKCLERQGWEGYDEIRGEDEDFDATMKQLHPLESEKT